MATTLVGRRIERSAGWQRRARRRASVAVGLGLVVFLMLTSLAVGSRSMPLRSVWDALWSYDSHVDDQLIVRELRIPRTLLGAAVGCALGAAGAVMQSLTRNPLAEPGLLGINSGAAAAVAVAIGFGFTSVMEYVWFAFAGAAAAGVLVYALGGGRRSGTNPVRLTLAGAALSVVLGSFTQLILLNYPDTFAEFRFWGVGSLQGRGYEVLAPLSIFIGIGLVGAMLLARSLNSVALGADTGRALGVSAWRTQAMSAGVVILLCGSATAAAGPIGFVGLTAPYVARLLVGPDHRWLLPASMLTSTIVVLGADILGRVVARPGEVGTGIVAAIVGGPFFIVLVRRRKIAAL